LAAAGAMDPAAGTGSGPGADAVPARPVRIEPYPAPGDTYVLPLDTGSDTLFVMASRGRSWDRAPVEVPVHRHDDEDEYIVLGGGEGWLLNGPSPETVQRVPFRGPCLLVMPAGTFHRVVRTDDDIVDSVLVYAHRRALAAPWDVIVVEMEVAGR
ncbi:MAG: cupin domain-containing protein, partial [Chloroflexota bacterium]